MRPQHGTQRSVKQVRCRVIAPDMLPTPTVDRERHLIADRNNACADNPKMDDQTVRALLSVMNGDLGARVR